jgi:hypothetical protein
MDVQWRDKWVEALRSGKYKQGRGGLRDTRFHYCCLGVLCDVIDPNGWNGVEHKGEIELPVNSILSGVGLTLIDTGPLTRMNDSGQSFNVIARYIERNL